MGKSIPVKYQLISNAQNMLSVQCVEYSFVYKETCLSHVAQEEILCVRILITKNTEKRLMGKKTMSDYTSTTQWKGLHRCHLLSYLFAEVLYSRKAVTKLLVQLLKFQHCGGILSLKVLSDGLLEWFLMIKHRVSSL